MFCNYAYYRRVNNEDDKYIRIRVAERREVKRVYLTSAYAITLMMEVWGKLFDERRESFVSVGRVRQNRRRFYRCQSWIRGWTYNTITCKISYFDVIV